MRRKENGPTAGRGHKTNSTSITHHVSVVEHNSIAGQSVTCTCTAVDKKRIDINNSGGATFVFIFKVLF